MIEHGPDQYEVVFLHLRRGNVRFEGLPDEIRGDPGFLTFLLQKWRGDRFIRRFDFFPERVRTDRPLLETLLRTGGGLLRVLPSNLKDDRDLVLAALSESGQNLVYASARLRDDEEIVLTAIHREDDWGAMNVASDRLLADPIFALRAVLANRETYGYFTDISLSDRDQLLSAVRIRGHVLHLASETLRDDRDLVRIAVAQDPSLLALASDRLRDDEGLVRLAIGLSPSALQHASDRLRDDRDLVRIAMEADPNAVRHASDRLRDDPELIREAILLGVNGDPSVRQDETFDFGVAGLGVYFFPGGESPLLFASERLRDDPDLVRLALRTGYSPLSAVSGRLRDDPELMAEAVLLRPHDLQRASDRLRDDPDLVRLTLRADPLTIQHASERLRADPELALEAVLGSRDALRFVHESVRYRPELVRAAEPPRDQVPWLLEERLPHLSGRSLLDFSRCLPDWVWSDPDLVRTAVCANGLSLMLATPLLRADLEVARIAVSCRPDALAHVLGQARRDPSLIRDAVTRDPFALAHVEEADRAPLLADQAFMARLDREVLTFFGAPTGELAPMSGLERKRAARHLRRLSTLLDQDPPVPGREIRLDAPHPRLCPAQLHLLLAVSVGEVRVRHLILETDCARAFLTVEDRPDGGGRRMSLRADHGEESMPTGEYLCELMKFRIRYEVQRRMSEQSGPEGV